MFRKTIARYVPYDLNSADQKMVIGLNSAIAPENFDNVLTHIIRKRDIPHERDIPYDTTDKAGNLFSFFIFWTEISTFQRQFFFAFALLPTLFIDLLLSQYVDYPLTRSYFLFWMYSWMPFAAALPAPMARITVAAPVTASPPANTPSRDVWPFSSSAMMHL